MTHKSRGTLSKGAPLQTKTQNAKEATLTSSWAHGAGSLSTGQPSAQHSARSLPGKPAETATCSTSFKVHTESRSLVQVWAAPGLLQKTNRHTEAPALWGQTWLRTTWSGRAQVLLWR